MSLSYVEVDALYGKDPLKDKLEGRIIELI